MSERSGPDLHVLLVEDEPANRALVRAIVERGRSAGKAMVELLEAGTVGAARAIIETERIDVALLDVRLPDGSGLDLVEALRQSDAHPWIVVISASVLPGERRVAIDAGADEFLAKPFRAGDLIAVLGAVAERRGRPPEPASGVAIRGDGRPGTKERPAGNISSYKDA